MKGRKGLKDVGHLMGIHLLRVSKDCHCIDKKQKKIKEQLQKSLSINFKRILMSVTNLRLYTESVSLASQMCVA